MTVSKCRIQSWLTILKGIPPSKRGERSNDEDHLGLEDLNVFEDPEAHGREFQNSDDHDFGESGFQFNGADEGNA